MSLSVSQITKFIMMGSLAALVHGTVLYIIVNQFYVAVIWANILAFLVAFIVSFLGHFGVTFRQSINTSDRKQALAKLSKWFTTSLLGFALNQSLFVLGIYWFSDAYYLLIWLVVTAIVTIVSFLLGKFWAFKSE